MISRLLPTPAPVPPVPCAIDVTPGKVPHSAYDLPWLHIAHRLLLCPACSPGRHPVSQLSFEKLLLP
jgi:hypothetical protein